MPHVKSGTAGIVAMGSTPDEFRAFVDEEIARWRKVITDAGIQNGAVSLHSSLGKNVQH